MSSRVSVELRRLVVVRASLLCEYCLIHEEDTFVGCQVDHVISEKHGGETSAENLAYACAFCNQHKGSDIASRSATGGELVPLFNPRRQLWHEHFSLDGPTITPSSKPGEVTARLLRFNDPDRLLERTALAKVGRYPTPAARLLSNPGSV